MTAAAARSPRILIVDEDEPFTHVLTLGMQLEGWSVDVAPDGASALAAVAASEPDIVLLDVVLPDGLGTEVARTLRAAGRHMPIVFVTGRDTHEDRLAGYAAGGDDYVTKPFGIEELIDHLQPIVRRLGLAPTSRRVGDLVIDADGAAWRDGEFLPLTPLEFEMLRALVEEAGERVTIGQALRRAAARGIRIPIELAHGLMERVRRTVNGERGELVRGDETQGWMLAPA